MSLPSQSSRNATRSSQVHYRRSSGGPLKKLITIIVILAIIALVWFFFIRQRANKIATENPQTDAQTDGAIAANTPATQGSQPTIINNSPSRPLPGAGDASDPIKDVEQALRSQPNTHTPTNTDILDAAIDQARAQRTTTNQSSPTEQPRSSGSANGIRLQMDSARRLVAENNRVGARKLLSQTLLAANTTHNQAQVLRDELTAINEVLLFSPVVDPNDPMSESYKIKAGDSLSRIAGRRELATHWKLIARINQIADPSKIRLGQNIKLVRGPFHAIVHKSAHRLDIFHGSPANPDSWLYIKSFDVGLGSNDGTPIGEFVVSQNKLENPGWVNPRNAREQYDPNDPANPIGEYWIGITGVGQYSSLTSLGLHGTIDQNSIGANQSMGCVRLAEGDIDTVYELLAEHISRVLIVP
ncbi:MAG: L,D-transpeptidase family protein [Phycisphaerales bacterium]|nr:L,D-transpeptidase family protein [Phycisphaerales bacterium]